MAIPDLAQLERELAASYPESWVRHLLATLPPSYFSAHAPGDIATHLELSRLLSEEHPVALRALPLGQDEWRLDVVGLDAFQFLATLCNALAARGLSILEGRVFTSRAAPTPSAGEKAEAARPSHGRLPQAPRPSRVDRRRRAIDTFRVRRIDRRQDPFAWDELEQDLVALVRLLRDNRPDSVSHRTVGRFVAALDRYEIRTEADAPIEITIEPDADDETTSVRVQARDSPGFLYLTAGALAQCGIRIVEAQIRTDEGRVDDTFHVTDAWGRKIVDEARIRELRLSLILIEHFSAQLPRATDPEAALIHFSRFATEMMAQPRWSVDFAALDRPDVLDRLVRVLGESHFLWEDYLHARPATFLPMICDRAEWECPRDPSHLAAGLETEVASASTPNERLAVLREAKDRNLFRADVRAILGLTGGLEGFSAELSDLAEVLLSTAHRHAFDIVGREPPQGKNGQPVPSVICGLGKLGGRELGFASDLELMLIYDDCKAETDSLVPAFEAVAKALQLALGAHRGRSLEIDFRLRPHGRGGALATALSTFRGYYQGRGPAWSYERQALIKLRCIAGDALLGREVEALRDEYVYGPMPFDLAALRHLRCRQAKELVTPGTVNAKYSPGALVDIEYAVQALQITHGAGDSRLRTPNTLRAVSLLEETYHISPETAAGLRSAYRFFRALIDALRVVHGHAKDLTVPGAATEDFALLARRMRASSPLALREELDARRRKTREVVELLLEFLQGPTGPYEEGPAF
jgi:glutamate-ammonia-ligase adenylyltransferase